MKGLVVHFSNNGDPSIFFLLWLVRYSSLSGRILGYKNYTWTDCIETDKMILSVNPSTHDQLWFEVQWKSVKKTLTILSKCSLSVLRTHVHEGWSKVTFTSLENTCYPPPVTMHTGHISCPCISCHWLYALVPSFDSEYRQVSWSAWGWSAWNGLGIFGSAFPDWGSLQHATWN